MEEDLASSTLTPQPTLSSTLFCGLAIDARKGVLSSFGLVSHSYFSLLIGSCFTRSRSRVSFIDLSEVSGDLSALCASPWSCRRSALVLSCSSSKLDCGGGGLSDGAVVSVCGLSSAVLCVLGPQRPLDSLVFKFCPFSPSCSSVWSSSARSRVVLHSESSCSSWLSSGCLSIWLSSKSTSPGAVVEPVTLLSSLGVHSELSLMPDSSVEMSVLDVLPVSQCDCLLQMSASGFVSAASPFRHLLWREKWSLLQKKDWLRGQTLLYSMRAPP